MANSSDSSKWVWLSRIRVRACTTCRRLLKGSVWNLLFNPLSVGGRGFLLVSTELVICAVHVLMLAAGVLYIKGI